MLNTHYTFDIQKLNIADYLALSLAQSMPKEKQLEVLIALANKANNQSINIYELPMSEIECVLNTFGAILKEYFDSRNTPPQFWKWGNEDAD